MDKAWHEFIAYAVQFDLMDPMLKHKVMQNYPGVEPFEHPENVNQFVHAFDPDKFGVCAYLFAQSRGGADFLREILNDDESIYTGWI